MGWRYAKMKDKMVLLLAVVLAVGFVVSGCAKKAIEPSMSPPMPQADVKEASPDVTGEPTMQVEPGLQGQAGSSGGASPQASAAIEEADIYFEFDSFGLTPKAKKVLADKAAYLKAHPAVKVLIEGHCDERGTAEYNLALGERRARAALDYLVFLGIDPKRLTSVSYGEERPVDPGHNEEAWAKNRRAHFVVTEGS